MNIWKISLKNIKSKPLYTFLSIFILALSIALLLGIQQLKTSFQHQMDNNLGGVDLVIGAKGSPLQLILASILHIDNPTGNISYGEAKKIGKSRLIKTAVPISYGDNYKGYRIVGTTHQFATLYDTSLEKGKNFEASMEVVLGSTVAEQTGLKIGDTFKSSHGLIENEIDIHDDELKVVGILKPTKKVIDRLIVTNLESVWATHNHGDHDEEGHEQKDHEDIDNNKHDKGNYDHDDHIHDENHNHEDENHVHHEEHEKHENHTKEDHAHDETHNNDNDKNHEHKHDEHEDEKEITSLLIQFRSPAALLTMPRKINEETNMQAALPKYELDRLYEYTGVGFKTITWIAYLILIISGLTIFISLYKMVKERSFDLALLRTYGANNLQLIKMVLYEGLIIGFLAFLIGFLFIRIGLHFMLTFVASDKQNILQDLPLQNVLQISGLVFVMIILSISLAIYPIIKMNISTILSNEK